MTNLLSRLGVVLALVAAPIAAQAQISDDVVKIGVLTDMTGSQSDSTGPGSFLAARMAAEDFGGQVLGKPIVVISGDHQNKPDIGSNIVRQWLSATRDMSGFGSTRSVRFVPEGSHAAGGQNGPDHRCDWIASSEEVELHGGGGAVGDERAALSPVARRL